MTEFLVRHFIKDYQDIEKISVRTAYGVLASIVGIFCNVFLFIVKFAAGLVLHSVSVTADAFNNLSDAGSSIISFAGVKMAEKPADRSPVWTRADRVHCGFDRILSCFGSGVYVPQGFFWKDLETGGVEFPDGIRRDPDFIYRGQTMAGPV